MYEVGKINIPYLKAMQISLETRVKNWSEIVEKHKKGLISEDSYNALKIEYKAEIGMLDRLIKAYKENHI